MSLKQFFTGSQPTFIFLLGVLSGVIVSSAFGPDVERVEVPAECPERSPRSNQPPSHYLDCYELCAYDRVARFKSADFECQCED